MKLDKVHLFVRFLTRGEVQPHIRIWAGTEVQEVEVLLSVGSYQAVLPAVLAVKSAQVGVGNDGEAADALVRVASVPCFLTLGHVFSAGQCPLVRWRVKGAGSEAAEAAEGVAYFAEPLAACRGSRWLVWLTVLGAGLVVLATVLWIVAQDVISRVANLVEWYSWLDE